MYQDAVRVPRTYFEDTTRRQNKRKMSLTGSGFSINHGAIQKDSPTVLPGNVLALPTLSHNVGHPAAYPVALPEWFIRLFTQEGDLVLDPFLGSGTTAIAAANQGRNWIGCEKFPDYIPVAEARIVKEREKRAA
jgi:site-specific DNA-methyltransferase (adenine-specific)